MYILIGESCMEIKTEADSNDMTECPHDDKPTIGMLDFFLILLTGIHVCSGKNSPATLFH